METHITTKENLLKRYMNEMKFLKSSSVSFAQNEIISKLPILYYQECFLIEIKGIVTLIKIPNNSNIYRHPDTIRVDNNVRYTIPNILDGYVINGNILLEGADGVGKTTISKGLAYKGIITEDRNVPNISWVMEPQYERNERIETIQKYIECSQNKTIVFFYNSNEKELLDRIETRGTRSDYDKFALYKQEKYLDTYEVLHNFRNLILYNVSGKSIYEITTDIEAYSTSVPKRLVRK